MARDSLIRFRRGNQTEWLAINNPNGAVLSAGEPGFDSVNNILKVGDGTTPWNSLSPVNSGIDTFIDGFGTSGNLPLFIDSNTLTNSIIHQSGSNVGIGTVTPAYKLDVDGSGRFRCAPTGLGLAVVNAGNSGLLFGEIAYGSYGGSYSGDLYTGMTHTALSGEQEYMLLSKGDHTFMGAKDGYSSIIRGGNNDQTYQLIAAPTYLSVGQFSEKMKFDSSKVQFNLNNENLDFAVHGDALNNVLYVDASVDRVGIGTDTPLTQLHIHATNSEATILSQTDLDYSFAGFLVRNQDNVNVFSAQYCNSGVAQTGLRDTILIGSRESGVPVKFYQGKETTNIIGANGAFEPNNERIIFDVDGNTTLTAASGQNVAVSGGNDFIVYGTGSHPLIYTDPDSGTGRVGIGTATPSGKLHIQDGTLHILSDGSIPHFELVDTDTNNTLRLNATNSVFAFNLDPDQNIAGSELRFNVDGTDKLTLKHNATVFDQNVTINSSTNQAIVGNSITVFNQGGHNIDFRVEGDTDENLLFCDASLDKVGIGTASPSQKLDVNSSGIRIRDDHTPASASAAGNKGEIVWDSNYVYVCVATNTWKRSTLSTW